MASQLDIARKTGISQSIVSRVLTGRWRAAKIAESTAARVLEAARELGYHPNRAANIVFGRKSNLIGVIVRSFRDPFLATILEEINSRAADEDFGVIVAGLSRREDPAQVLQRMQGYRPDAVIVVGTMDFEWGKEGEGALPQNIILIGLRSRQPGVLSCSTDETAGAAMLVEHLADLGHRKFGFAGDNSKASALRLRLLRKAIAAHGCALGEELLFRADSESGEISDGEAESLSRSVELGKVTGIICAGDMIAAGVVRKLRLLGIRIPRDLSLASYNDLPMASLLDPPLTTLRLPVRRLARAAMEIATGRSPGCAVEVRPDLKVRKSTGPVPVQQGSA